MVVGVGLSLVGFGLDLGRIDVGLIKLGSWVILIGVERLTILRFEFLRLKDLGHVVVDMGLNHAYEFFAQSILFTKSLG